MGKKDLGLNIEGIGTRLMQVTVGDVVTNLLSVDELADMGCEVIFSKTNSRIVDGATEKCTPLKRAGKRFEVEFELEPFATMPTVKTRSRG